MDNQVDRLLERLAKAISDNDKEEICKINKEIDYILSGLLPKSG